MRSNELIAAARAPSQADVQFHSKIKIVNRHETMRYVRYINTH